ncbi:MAG TPA: oxidoreductase [Myxococcales bacterium]|nr:hypothetical protein [Deltaproteobacteria bacterium]MBU48053.1 hypothetical protein [Deltaproteobacteria bacterium]HAA55663.1 oxidoreductase [Myxococcales bacterium]|tara:strand:- start:9702 stop:12608 length:2907 start_codon:yes stop_codon:yes gene_type:complete
MSRSTAAKEAFAALQHSIEGEVRTDSLSKMLYSTDASIYQVEPYGVVIPRHEEDVIRTVQVASTYGVPIIPRAGGTSLAGQCVGKGIVLDISKYMNKMLDFNPEEEWALVQPGVIQDDLTRMVAHENLMFGPDTSTSNRAMIGGMIGNNSCGAHSLHWGKTVDHTLETDVVLHDGSLVRFKDLTPAEVERKKQQQDLEGHIYREITRIIDTYKQDIEDTYPKILRRNTGYLLDELIDERKPLNLSRLLCASEGTLGLVTKARMKLVQRPEMNGLVALQFDDLGEALRATVIALEHAPCAIELMDRVVLDLADKSYAARHLRFFIEGKPQAILPVEFYGYSKKEIEAKMDGLIEHLKREGLGYAFPKLWGNDINKVWKLRKAGLGLLMALPGDAKPATFMEDTGVPPEHLPEYVENFQKIMEKYDTNCTYYAHASVGVLHMRPILNLKDPTDLKKMVDISHEVVDLVIKYGGSVSAEHGDGRLRAPFAEKFFGPKLYGALKETKHAFDPNKIFNPNKIVDALPMDTDQRYPPDYVTHDIPTQMTFEKQHGYLRAIEFCNGAGACRKSPEAQGTMCPSYQGTREETHTTRGRANVLRTAIAQYGPNEAFTRQEVWDAMDMCLECKACKSECPSSVDMAKIKYEYLQRRWDLLGTPLHALAIGHLGTMNRFIAPFASLANKLLRHPWIKWLNEKLLHVDQRRSFPVYADITLEKWFLHRPKEARHPNAGKLNKTVYFFADVAINYNEPHIGKASIETLEAAGYHVELAPISDDGRTRISKGLLHSAKSLARKNLFFLKELVQKDTYMIGAEPSMILTFRDEYPDFFPELAYLKEMSKRCLMIEEFIVQQVNEGEISFDLKESDKTYRVHGHCNQKALVGTGPSLELIKMIPGTTVEEIPSGCCGMAGSFGFEAHKYDLSMKIGEIVLLPAVRQRGEADVLAPGTSCRHQILDGAAYEAPAPIEIFHKAIVK